MLQDLNLDKQRINIGLGGLEMAESQNVLYGDVNELIAIRDELKEFEKVKKKVGDLTLKSEKLKKDIDAEEKALRDTIDATVKKRREQVVENFDKDLKNNQDKLKKVKSSREKAKTKGMEGRIKEETAELVQENRNLREEIKTYNKQKGISSVFNSDFIYSLIFPGRISDLIKLLIAAVISVVAVPTIVTKLLSLHKALEIIIFILIAAVMPTIYVFAYRYAHIVHKYEFLEKKEQRIKLRKNMDKIERIKRNIHKDKDEARYNLETYDEEIQDLEDLINDIVQKKNQVLTKFESVTKPEIEEEIVEREQPKIDKVKVELTETQIELKSYNESQKNMSMKISSTYAAYMGNEYMTISKIDKLIAIISEGNAKTIGEAINAAKLME